MLFINLPDDEGFFLRPSDETEPRGDEGQRAVSDEVAAGAGAAPAPAPPLFYVLLLEPRKSENPPDRLKEYVLDAVSLHQVCLSADLESRREKVGCALQPSFLLHDVSTPSQQDPSCYLQRCLVCVFDPKADKQEVDQLWREMAKKEEQLEMSPRVTVLKFERLNRERLYRRVCMDLQHCTEEQEEVGRSQLYRVSGGPSISPGPAPLFDHTPYAPVFHCWEEVQRILEMCQHLEPVRKLLEIVRTEQPSPEAATDAKQPKDEDLQYKLVVVEGMDGAGKSTLIESLEKAIPGVKSYYAVPDCLIPLRREFDALPEIVRRAYYCVGNYIRAKQFRRECQEHHVIMDRCWHSSAAYGIANESGHRELPPVGHVVYRWPQDLLQPSIVVFLTVSEEVRRQRMGGRSDQQTVEERALNRDQNFRDRLCGAYKRMRNPACVEISADGTPDDVMAGVVSLLREHDIAINM